METTFKVTVLGIQPDRDPKEVRDKLRPILTNDDVAFEKIFHSINHNKPVILTAGIPQTGAKNLAEILTTIGLKCRLDPMTLTLLPIDNKPRAIYRCPACGHYQQIAEDNQPDICQHCGAVGSHHEKISEKISNRNLLIEGQSKRSQRTTPRRKWGVFPILGLLGMTTVALIGIGRLLWQPTDSPDAGLLPAAPPHDDPASDKIANLVAHDPQLLAKLARYQLQAGDLTAATHTITRGIALLGSQRNDLTLRQVEALMRVQVEIQAEIARQHHQRQDPATAQTYWLKAARLANAITTPEERALAFSGLARMMNDREPATAGNYFSRAIEVTRLIEKPFDQAAARGTIARDLARAERPEQAQTLFDQALAAVAAVPDPESRRVARTILAKHLAEAGDGTAASALLAQVTEETGNRSSPELSQHHAEALGALALSLANEEDQALARIDFAAALEQARMLTDPARRAGTLLSLARDMAAAGDLEMAAKLAAAAGSWD